MEFAEKKYPAIVSAMGIAALVRFVALWLFPDIPLDDMANGAYLGGAHLLLYGNGFSDSSYPVLGPPLYAIFIALCSSLPGNEQMLVKIAQIIIDSLTVAIIYLIAREMFGLTAALLSAGIWAIYPFAVYCAISIGSETLFTFFLSVFVLLALHSLKSPSLKLYSSSGICLALATLTRGTTLFFPIIFLAVVLLWSTPKYPWFKRCLAFLVSFVLVIFPWSLRNYIVLDEFIPVATSGQMVFLRGADESFFTIEDAEKNVPLYIEKMRLKGIHEPLPASGPGQKADFLARIATERYKERFYAEPETLIPFLLTKLARLWYATESGRNQALIVSANAIIYLLALLGALLAWPKKNECFWLLLAILGYFVAIHTVLIPLFRYMLPVIPYVIMFAAFSMASATALCRERKLFEPNRCKV